MTSACATKRMQNAEITFEFYKQRSHLNFINKDQILEKKNEFNIPSSKSPISVLKPVCAFLLGKMSK